MTTRSPQPTTNAGPKLLDQARGILRAKHYSFKTEQSYIHWILRSIRFRNTRRPKEMGEKEINLFLTHLAVKENVAAYGEREIGRLVREAGGVWNRDERVWELPYREVLALGLMDRIVA